MMFQPFFFEMNFDIVGIVVIIKIKNWKKTSIQKFVKKIEKLVKNQS